MSESPGGLIKNRLPGPNSTVSNLVGLERGLRICICDKVLKSADAAGVGTTLRDSLTGRAGGLESRSQSTRLALSKRREISFTVIGRKKRVDIGSTKVGF